MNKVVQGAVSYRAGLAAEDAVARLYGSSGHALVARRWRGTGGEIDLVMRKGAELVFVEVKKSRDFAHAAERLTRRQLERIFATASEFLAGEPGGLDTPARFDVALVDRMGRIDIVDNVMAA